VNEFHRRWMGFPFSCLTGVMNKFTINGELPNNEPILDGVALLLLG
jgi:hypothetical protein